MLLEFGTSDWPKSDISDFGWEREQTAAVAPVELTSPDNVFMTHPEASVQGVTKRFGATAALAGADFDVAFGEIHAIVGENGAGKSTLIRILGGVHRPDRGEVSIDGRPCRFASPRDAIAAGIVTIPQELRLVPALSIAENIALGDLPGRRLIGLLPTVDRAR